MLRAKPTGVPVFPLDIWWLITQELASQHDFGGLFLCARLSRDVANLALPLLYGIHEQSTAIHGDIDDETPFEISVGLWRSIIASSLGKTLYPYCCWIRALKLGNLDSHLVDLERGNNAALKAKFFSPPLDEFQIKLGKTRKQQLDRKAVIIKVSDSITSYIQSAAQEQGKHVTLATLEGYHLPTASLQGWVSKLSRLSSLVVQDGSVLTSDVARVIREKCPNFKEVECYFCQGLDVDEQLAGFFNDLTPESIESFTIRSRNDLGIKTFEALNRHSGSLKRLTVQGLDATALLALPALSDCLALEKLILEGGMGIPGLTWQGEGLKEMKEWLKKCSHLKELELTVIASATEILSEVLKNPSIRLTALTLKLIDSNKEFYVALASQTALRQLALKIVDDTILEANDGRRDLFVDALCSMEQLRELDTNELFTSSDIRRISHSTHSLEELVLNGDIILDDFILELCRMKHLKSINIFGPSALSANEESALAAWVRNSFGGNLDIMYHREPDELQESDFSD
ncbi:hypothetical protein QBC42DRAFT_190927 [Cladorrhinum samala]|uniref:Uncharacterized protein n=1 Tax=Cladorrhinum samala TaxID=585594 RepID=A0AAV9H994_9PEZI|nr:hypothetical protein QBC42DRAFT_190927 [Cladorrhinum samala]